MNPSVVALLTLVLAVLAAGVECISSSGNRVLVSLPRKAAKETYSKFLGQIEARNFDVRYTYGSKISGLFSFDQRTVDHIVILNPGLEHAGGELGFGELISFINAGGNVLVAADSEISETLRALAIEFSVDFDENGTIVKDVIGASGVKSLPVDGSKLAISNFDTQSHIFDSIFNTEGFNPANDSIIMSGIGHKLTGRNPFISSLARTSDYAISYDKKERGYMVGIPLTGSDLSMISLLQARNNARIAFVGSTDLFSNAAFTNKDFKNEIFTTLLTKYVLQETGVIRQKGFYHHSPSEDFQKGIYYVKDEVKFELDVELWDSKSGEWTGFSPSDIQLEITMLDPYIRKTFSKTETPGKLLITEKLPDVHGVFTYGIIYRRPGYSYIEHNEQVQVRPPRHDQYPRFLPHAWPYYVNVWSLFAGFWVVSSITLLYR